MFRYEFGQSIINSLFGPKCHKDFPRLYRLDAGPCKGEGFYPSKMEKSGQSEYAVAGVDLEIDVVAPFPGIVYKGDNPDEVIIEANTAALNDIKIYVNGVKVNTSILHPSDELYIENRVVILDRNHLLILNKVTGGYKWNIRTGLVQDIPSALSKESPCYPFNHIHFAMKKGNGTVDPTKFLSPRFFKIPKWIQTCDDYKLVYQFETIAVGVIVGLGGQAENNTSPDLDLSKILQPDPPATSEDPGQGVDTIKSDTNGMYSKTKSNPNYLTDDSKNRIKDRFTTLMRKADSFMKKFSLRRLKMGTIMNFLTKLGMTDSRAKFVLALKNFGECPLMSFTFCQRKHTASFPVTVWLLKIEKTDLETVATFGGGLCEPGSYCEEKLFGAINLLDQAVLPLPICNPDGSYSWPNINWATYFSKEAVMERLKQAGRKAAKQLAGNLAKEVLAALGLPASLLGATGPCPRPENMTLALLKGKMIEADLSTDGTRLVLNSRYALYDRSKTQFLARK
ncbi:unnamed protein product [Mytilus edulis]|uniref:Uncharacterized protein n=1 Tax=Mytilus edulis TaxID=6550 RepID=A0A8S3R1E8_MYTED|nr:unnamed protein product [Mytilus edulis]